MSSQLLRNAVGMVELPLPAVTMTRSNSVMSENDERRELQARQVALKQRSQELEREIERLHGTGDRPALRALQEQLRRHKEEVKAFDERLAMFHARFGPIGRDEKDF